MGRPPLHPLCAALLGPNLESIVAVIVYGRTLALTAAIAYAIWWYATSRRRRRLVDGDLNPEPIRFLGGRIAIDPSSPGSP